jgi:hypothetical protein
MTARNNDNILVHYRKNQTYSRTDNNVIGATTNSTLRTITTPAAGTTNYVRKWGKAYTITDITGDTYGATRSTAGNGWKFEFRTVTTDALLYTITDDAGVVTVTDGTTVGTAEALYIKLIWIQGTMNVVDGSTIAITTSGISEAGSTYYDSGYKHGGYRHTPLVGDSRYSYFHPSAAHAALGARTIVHVLDSEVYQIKETISLGTNETLQAALGHKPAFMGIIGASAYRDIENDGSNNSDSIYVSTSGDDSTGDGRYQNPYKTHSQAITGIGSKTWIITKDSNNYQESVKHTPSVPLKFEALYGQIPALLAPELFGDEIFELNSCASFEIYGYKLDGQERSAGIIEKTTTATAMTNFKSYNCEYTRDDTRSCIHLNQINSGAVADTIVVKRCYMHDGNVGVNAGWASLSAAHSVTLETNYVENMTAAGLEIASNVGGTLTLSIKNNFLLNTSNPGGDGQLDLELNAGGLTVTGTIENNTVVDDNELNVTKSANGIYIVSSGAYTATVRNNLSRNNGTWDMQKGGTTAITVTDTSYLLGNGFTFGSNTFTTDPKFIDLASKNYNINPSGPCWKTGNSNENIGIASRIITIAGSSATINGIIFDGTNFYSSAIATISTVTGKSIKWCTIKNFAGNALEEYGASSTSSTIENNLISSNSNGVSSNPPGASLKNNIFLSNSNYGLWGNSPSSDYDKNTFYQNYVHFYIGTSMTNYVVKDCIFHSARSASGILADIAATALNCCITDAVGSLLDKSSSTNLIDNPLFVNTNDGSEDLHLKSKKDGFSFDSPCAESASDGGDMGAYSVTYSLTDYSFRKYHFEENPLQNNIDNAIKGGSSFTSITGSLTMYGDYHKRIFPMQFSNYTTKTQRDKLAYLNGFYPTRENGLVRNDCIMRYHLLPTSFLMSSTGTLDHATYWDSTDKQARITDTSETWQEDQWRGWHVGVKFETVSDAVVDAAAKTITKAGAFAGDDYTDYFVYIDKNYYVVTSNTNDALTLSDANGTLTSQTVTVSVEKYFKIVSNDTNYMTIYDPENELLGLDGSYAYYIDFIEVVTQKDNQKYRQNRFSWNEERTKANNMWTVEEA